MFKRTSCRAFSPLDWLRFLLLFFKADRPDILDLFDLELFELYLFVLLLSMNLIESDGDTTFLIPFFLLAGFSLLVDFLLWLYTISRF